MAPTRLLLEGPAIEPLLRRARAEHGPNVRIVKAERVRVGGLVGFFAREQFEVTLEVADDGGAPPAPAPAPWVRHQAPGQLAGPPSAPVTAVAGPQGLDALLAAAEDAERMPGAAGRGDFDSIFTSVLTARGPAQPAAAQPAPGPAQVLAAAEVAQPVRVLTAAGAVPAAHQVPGLAGPVEQTGQQLLASGPASAVALAGTPVSRPVTATSAGDGRQISLPETPQVQRPAPATLLPGAPPGPAPRGPAPLGPAPSHLGVQTPVAPGLRHPGGLVPHDPRATTAGHGHRHSDANSHGRHAHHHHHDTGGFPLSERLAELGVPGEWLWDLPAGRSAALRSIAARIAVAQARIPRIPITSPAPVLAVMAELSAAVPVARHLAAGLGLDASEVPVLQRRGHGHPHQRLLAGGRDLLSQARSRRLEGRPLVVALPAPIGSDPVSRSVVSDVLGELEPDEVWAVVDATRRLPDTSAWLASLDGPRGVDALALVHVGATSAPAAALALPLPVVLLGERPASPRAWVEMLAARLSDGVAR